MQMSYITEKNEILYIFTSSVKAATESTLFIAFLMHFFVLPLLTITFQS